MDDVNFAVECRVERIDFLIDEVLNVCDLSVNEILQILHFVHNVIVHRVDCRFRVFRILVEIFSRLFLECLVCLIFLFVSGRKRVLKEFLVAGLNLSELLRQNLAD